MNKKLLYRFFTGTASPAEVKEVRTWAEASPENKEEIYKERRFFDTLNLLVKEDNTSGRNIYAAGHFRNFFLTFSKVAAIVFLTLLSTWFYQEYFSSEDGEITENTIRVPAGQYIDITLSDGTRVWLNSRSVIHYPSSFGKGIRNVRLEGEAYFEVARNDKKRFVVETDLYNIEALGTSFNVMAYDPQHNFATSLLNGSVKITSVRDTSFSLHLSPGNMASTSHDGLIVTSITDYNHYRWREGLICFENITFSDLMIEFEKYYGLEIEIKNQRVRQYVCTGKFRITDGIDYALKVLQSDIRFQFERKEDLGVIYIY